MKHLKNIKLCEITNRIRLKVHCFGYANFGPEWNGERLKPEFSYLYYIMNGSSCIIANGEEIHLTPGNWYLIPAGCSFKFSCPKYAEHVYFHLSLQNDYELDMLNRFTGIVKKHCPIEDTALLADNVDSNDVVIGMKVYQKAHSVLISMFEENNINLQPKKLSPCVISAVEYIRTNLSASLNVSEIAKHARVSKSTLTKKFRSELSTSVINYTYELLMYRAKQRLSQTNMSIRDIAEELGFSEQFYFSKRFKIAFGISPIKFRQFPHI